MESNQNDEAIIKHISKLLQSKKEITDEFLKFELKEKFVVNEVKRIELLSLMHQCGFISIHQKGTDVIYSTKQKESISYEFSSEAESKIYEEIQNAKEKGIGKLELKSKTKLNQGLITKCLKNLEKLGYVVNHKSKNKSKFLYFSTDCIPDENLIGGNLYKDGDIDYEVLSEIYELLISFLNKKSEASYGEILSHLTSKSIGSMLSTKEIQIILNNLCLDQKVFKRGDNFSLAIENKIIKCEIEKQIPCFKCPVFEQCNTGNLISPENCIYYENW
jgi:ribosomal protein S25